MSKKHPSQRSFKKKELDFEKAFNHPEIKPPHINKRKSNPIAFIFTIIFVVIFILGMILPTISFLIR